jgi:hypothetical protein
VTLFVEFAENKTYVNGKEGWVRYVTEVTMPYVPPPPPRTAQNKSGFLYEFTVRYCPVEVTTFNSMTLSIPGKLSENYEIWPSGRYITKAVMRREGTMPTA